MGSCLDSTNLLLASLNRCQVPFQEVCDDVPPEDRCPVWVRGVLRLAAARHVSGAFGTAWNFSRFSQGGDHAPVPDGQLFFALNNVLG